MWKILVVDDNLANRQLLIEILRDRAICDTATNGREAAERYNASLQNKEPYNIILLDIAMPEVDGLQFLNLVRENEKKAGISLGEGIPIIMVTAFQKPFLEAFNQGCDDYILKPVDADKLIAKIEQKLDGRN